MDIAAIIAAAAALLGLAVTWGRTLQRIKAVEDRMEREQEREREARDAMREKIEVIAVKLAEIRGLLDADRDRRSPAPGGRAR